MMYHTDKKCRNCVLNGECLMDDSDVEYCDAMDEEPEDRHKPNATQKEAK
jgi:hypothetical protein